MTISSTLKSICLTVASVAIFTTSSLAAMTAREFADARLAAFGKGDVNGLVEQYTEDATVITPMGVLHGKAQIRPMIEAIVAEFAQPGVKFTLISKAAEGDVVTFVWSADTAKAVYDFSAETYVLKDGLAHYQTFATKMTAK